MGDWFRSEPMSRIELILHEDACRAVIREIGIMGDCEFIDLNPGCMPFQRHKIRSAQACSLIEEEVLFLKSCCDTAQHQVIYDKGHIDAREEEGDLEEFLQHSHDYNYSGAGKKLMSSLSHDVHMAATHARELQSACDGLTEAFNTALERHHVLLLAISLTPKRVDFDISLNQQCLASKEMLLESGSCRELTSSAAMSEVSESNEARVLRTEVPEMRFLRTVGSIHTKSQQSFERLLFRTLRGNVHVRFKQLSKIWLTQTHATPNTQGYSSFSAPPDVPIALQTRLGFVIFHSSGSAVEAAVRRVCHAFDASLLDVDTELGDYAAQPSAGSTNKKDIVSDDFTLASTANAKIASKNAMLEAERVLRMNLSARLQFMSQISGRLRNWLWTARREKAVYQSMGLLQSAGGPFQRACAWVPTDCVAAVRAMCLRVHEQLVPRGAASPHSIEMCAVHLAPSDAQNAQDNTNSPPTLFRTSAYTRAFQQFVDTYGVPRYREANPALLTAATFPLLFGVMFGDLGHAFLLLCAAGYLVRQSEPGRGEVANNLYAARYMLLAMALGACYCGCLYSDWFSLTLVLFRSSYVMPEQSLTAHNATTHTAMESVAAYGAAEAVYPFGLDPAWHVSHNSLLFFNSFKMKMSVVLGVVHMTAGIVHKGLNCIYFARRIDFWCEFVPQILFCLSLFGYLVVLIFLKWAINWEQRMALGTCGYDATGHLGGCHLSTSATCYTATGTICSALSALAEVCPLDYGGTGDGCAPPNLITTLMHIVLRPGQVLEPMFHGQAQLQVALLSIAGVCVPWMLLLKPLLLLYRHRVSHTDASGAAAVLNPLQPWHTRVHDVAGKELEMVQLDPIKLRGDCSYVSLSQPEDAAEPFARGMHSLDVSSHDDLARNSDDDKLQQLEEEPNVEHDEDGHAFDFSELAIHQTIETIEFVLGMVSNTASYLRLWALSLAHHELAHVFWEKCMLDAIALGSPVLVAIGFLVFAGISTVVLLFMDVLECFLHALRLHWVEFQNKFYRGDGRRFRPMLLREAILSRLGYP